MAKLLLRRFAGRVFSFSIPVLIGVGVAEVLIICTALGYLISQIEPGIPSPDHPAEHLLVRLFVATAFVHVFFASFPNLLLVRREEGSGSSAGGATHPFLWAVVLSLFTPGFLVVEALVLWGLLSRWY